MKLLNHAASALAKEVVEAHSPTEKPDKRDLHYII